MKLLVICLFVPIAVLTLDSVLRLLFLCIVRQRRIWSQAPVNEAPLLSYALVIPAHNEAPVIGQMIGSLQQIDYPLKKYQIFVIADNCTDTTAVVAQAKGAYCLERFDSANPGKGKAIQWFLREAANVLQAFDTVVILDADSQVDLSFLREISGAFATGAQAVQGFVLPVPAQRSPVSSLAAYSELLAQKIEDAARSHLGWPVPLRGTGMAFRTKMLREIAPYLCTKAEDVEMSLLTADNGTIAFAPGAIVYDPKPPDAARAATQRARWLQSQMEIWQHYWRNILRLLIKGDIGQKALLFSLLLKPKVLVFSLKALFLGLFLAILFPLAWLRNTVVVLLSGAVLVDIAYYIIGLAFVDDPRFYAKALLAAPLYVLMWLRGMLIAIVSKEPWLRARD
ncbi:MAG: glycosyltransferase family 2 protein [Chloroflexi bacterium]|nr:glycosyltransferase family 2 protein [Chloroflexota bacterium]